MAVVFSLKTKMSVAVSLLVIVLMAAFGFMIIRLFDERYRETVSAQQYAFAGEIARHLDDAIRDSQRALIAAANDVPRDIVAKPSAAQRLLEGKPALHSIFGNGIFLFSPDGRMVAEFPDHHRRGLDLSFRDYYRRTVENARPWVSDPYLSSQAHHHPSIMFTAPVFGRDGGIVAILAGSIDLLKENIFGRYADSKIGKTGYVYLFAADRTMIMHPDRNRILKKDVPVGADRVFDKAIEGFDGTEETVDSRGRRVLMSVRRLKAVNWILAANLPVDEAYGPGRETVRSAIKAVALAALLTVAIVWFLMRYYTAPLLDLTRHLRKFPEEGERRKCVQAGRGDEIGALAGAFNALIGDLDRERDKLRELSRAVEETSSLVIIADTSGTITYVNTRFCDVTGYAARDVIGEDLRLFALGDMPPETYSRALETLKSGKVWSGDLRNRKKDGECFWTIATISPVKGEQGAITRLVSVQEDITLRKKEEWRLATQLSVSNAIAVSPTVGQAISRVLELICKAIGWNVGGVWWVDPKGDVLRLIESRQGPDGDAAGFLAASRARTFARGIGLPGRVWASGEAAWIDDVLLDDNYPRKAFAEACGLRGAFAFPITLGGETVGVMEFYSREVKPVDPSLLTDMAALGSLLGHLIERKHVQDALRESERRFRDTLENVRLAAVETDLTGRIVFCNEFFAVLSGWERGELAGRNWFDTFFEPGSELRGFYEQRIASGRLPAHDEYEIRTRGGEKRLIAWNNTLLYDPDGIICGTASIGQDITKQREVERMLRHVSTHDQLTGLYNRAYFEEEIGRLTRGRRFPVTVITADVDGLKRINDEQGHEAGDRLIQAVAGVLASVFRAEDVVARIGGDEFVTLLPETDAMAAEGAIRRLRQHLDTVNTRDDGFSVSLSIGFAVAEKGDEIPSALRVSDDRMYQDKSSRKAGRDTTRH